MPLYDLGRTWSHGSLLDRDIFTDGEVGTSTGASLNSAAVKGEAADECLLLHCIASNKTPLPR